MSYPDTTLEGSVDSFGWGIAQQNGSAGFEQLPSVKPTFKWIRLVQRIPVAVRIVITGTSPDGDRVPPVPRALQ